MLDAMDMAYIGFMAEEEGLLDENENNLLDKIANELNKYKNPTYDDLKDICIKYNLKGLTSQEMQYIGTKVKNR